jgi:hypothetical protein
LRQAALTEKPINSKRLKALSWLDGGPSDGPN